MSETVVIRYKACGQTPLEVIRELAKQKPELALVPMTYAGRLDPLASGVLVILVGDECLKKDEYLALPKEYEVDVLFGFATDTYDVMGRVDLYSSPPAKGEMPKAEGVHPSGSTSHLPFAGEDEIRFALKNFIGKITQKYPPYSSRTVQGKPLHQWAREGKIDQIEIPSHDVFVHSIEMLEKKNITGEELLQKINTNIGRVDPKSDFRQEEILNIWNEVLSSEKAKKEDYHIVKLKIICGSGVYVRSIAHDLGSALGVPALALNIVRRKVGEYMC